MLNGTIEIEITQPGRPTGQYTAVTSDRLKLEDIFYPEDTLPFDLAILPKTITGDGEHLRVLLLGSISHPPRTIVAAHLLGAIESDGNGLFLLAAPSADRGMEDLNNISDLPEQTLKEITGHLKLNSKNGEEFLWKGKEETEEIVKQASIRFRQVEAETRKQSYSTPAWQPADRDGRLIGYTEVEHYTEAVYTFFQLPYHFQHYVHAYLADDERILYALQRPAMRSCRQRSWLGGAKLQEGVLILTTQRLLQLVELTPPGSGGVRYGFNAQLGPLERLAEVSLEPCGNDAVVLKTCWLARQNKQTVEWEFPSPARQPLDELSCFLQKFIDGSTSGLALRRSMPSSPPDSLPRLKDPAANRPEELEPINEHFTALLSDLLKPDETAQAWALWPRWFEKRGYPQVLLVTDRRMLVIPDSDKNRRATLEVPLADLATLEYVGSILSSHIGLSIAHKDGIRELRLSFPYPAESAFHACFEALRRCMAVIPLCSEPGCSNNVGIN